mgnify:FL=1
MGDGGCAGEREDGFGCVGGVDGEAVVGECSGHIGGLVGVDAVGEYGAVGAFAVDADLHAGAVVVGFVGFVDHPCCGPVGVDEGVGGSGSGKSDVGLGHHVDVCGVLHR